jgi:hypothetical protein
VLCIAFSLVDKVDGIVSLTARVRSIRPQDEHSGKGKHYHQPYEASDSDEGSYLLRAKSFEEWMLCTFSSW